MIILNDNFPNIICVNYEKIFFIWLKFIQVYWIFNKSVSKVCNFSNNFFDYL